MDHYVTYDYETKMLGCNHHQDGKSQNEEVRLNGSINPRENSPFKSLTASHIISDVSPDKYGSSFIGYHKSKIGESKNSVVKPRNSIIMSTCKVRLPNGDTRSMTSEEMKNKYLAYVRTSLTAARFEAQQQNLS